MTTPQKEAAKFVFEGTVNQTKAANLKAITDKEHTVVVTVDKVVRAPQSLAAFAGREVTLRLAEGESVKKGQRALFHTNGWIFGENLAVQSLGHDPVGAAAPAAAAMAPAPDPARVASHQVIRERAASAPVVITGKVVAVGLPGTAPVAAAAGAAPPSRRISEHDPFWREAVVEVQAVHKGTVGKRQVVLRFPSSTDVRWHRAPKFETGQRGIFSLRQDDISGHATVGPAAASLTADTAPPAYTALHAADFQPLDHEAEAALAVSAAVSSAGVPP
jgi:hypothetical protein